MSYTNFAGAAAPSIFSFISLKDKDSFWHVRCRIFRRSYFPGRVSHLFLVSCTCPIPPLFFPLPPLPFRWRLKYSLLLRLRENGRRSFFRYAIPCVFVSSVPSTDKHFTVGSMGKIWPSQQVGESARESNLTLPKAQEKSSQIMLAQKKQFWSVSLFLSLSLFALHRRNSRP